MFLLHTHLSAKQIHAFAQEQRESKSWYYISVHFLKKT